MKVPVRFALVLSFKAVISFASVRGADALEGRAVAMPPPLKVPSWRHWPPYRAPLLKMGARPAVVQETMPAAGCLLRSDNAGLTVCVS